MGVYCGEVDLQATTGSRSPIKISCTSPSSGKRPAFSFENTKMSFFFTSKAPPSEGIRVSEVMARLCCLMSSSARPAALGS